MRQLSEIQYKNEFVEHFPGDDSGNLTPRQTPGVLYSRANPTPVRKVSLIGWSDDLGHSLDIEKPVGQKDIDILGGNAIVPTMQPYAACYAGHQFGNWAGQLGDGRAITLGEIQAADKSSWELQLKGPGRTPYSRSADGRAVLRSSVREFLMSEAMHYLGIPTTRALSLVATGEDVVRDMFYNGNPKKEPGAIVARLSPSFIRFGNFEILAARNEPENLNSLIDWTIKKYYPQFSPDDILGWFTEVVKRTALLIVEWLRVGFVHGVMNTDNMSILGLTIDYGPFSFLDEYDPNFTPNTTDLPGRRYGFGRQAGIAKWNLGCLGGAISLVYDDTEKLVEVLDGYDSIFWDAYYTMMINKLGLDEYKPEDAALISLLEKTLSAIKPDMTLFYQLLANVEIDNVENDAVLNHFESCFYNDLTPLQKDSFAHLISEYKNRVRSSSLSSEERLEKMRKANPVFILRNYLLHQAIEDLEQGDRNRFDRLLEALKNPYTKTVKEDLLEKRPLWASNKAGCSMLSCSS